MKTITTNVAKDLAIEFVGQMTDEDRIEFTPEGWAEAVETYMTVNGEEYEKDDYSDVLKAMVGIINRDLTADLKRLIEALRSEAGEAGDREQIAICDRAMDGDADAVGECRAVLRDALALANT